MRKASLWSIRQPIPRGVALVIGCCTFPTWNGYPGLFASLATGNAVVVKPHPGAILPLAITVKIARDVLEEAGFDPNVVTLVAHEPGDNTAQTLALRPEVKIVDYTGSTANGRWLEEHARQAQVYTEKAGVNQIVIDGTADPTVFRPSNGTWYSLKSSTNYGTAQVVTVGQTGDTPAPGDYDGVLRRLEAARSLGELVLDTHAITHPAFPKATVRTPLIVKLTANDRATYLNEWFGPIAFVIATDSTDQSLEIAHDAIIGHGALTLSAYSTRDDVISRAIDVAEDAGVALSINLTGGVFVNQSAAFSDFHGTGANPAANASLTDAAYVANRFRVVQHRMHA